MNNKELEAEIKQIFDGNINAGTTGLLMQLAERYAQSQLLQQTSCTTPFTCNRCGSNEKEWSRKNADWYCKTCGLICR